MCSSVVTLWIGAAVPKSFVDNEYATGTIREPKILLTTSRDPSAPLIQFVKVFFFVLLQIETLWDFRNVHCIRLIDLPCSICRSWRLSFPTRKELTVVVRYISVAVVNYYHLLCFFCSFAHPCSSPAFFARKRINWFMMFNSGYKWTGMLLCKTHLLKCIMLSNFCVLVIVPHFLVLCIFLAGLISYCWVLPVTWYYWSYFSPWTSRSTWWFGHLSSTTRSNCILWITQCGKCACYF